MIDVLVDRARCSRICEMRPRNSSSGYASTVKRAIWPTLHAADVRLIDVRLHLHLGEVLRDREQRRRLERRGDGLADVVLAVDDDAVDRRDDLRVARGSSPPGAARPAACATCARARRRLRLAPRRARPAAERPCLEQPLLARRKSTRAFAAWTSARARSARRCSTWAWNGVGSSSASSWPFSTWLLKSA